MNQLSLLASDTEQSVWFLEDQDGCGNLEGNITQVGDFEYMSQIIQL